MTMTTVDVLKLGGELKLKTLTPPQQTRVPTGLEKLGNFIIPGSYRKPNIYWKIRKCEKFQKHYCF